MATTRMVAPTALSRAAPIARVSAGNRVAHRQGSPRQLSSNAMPHGVGPAAPAAGPDPMPLMGDHGDDSTNRLTKLGPTG